MKRETDSPGLEVFGSDESASQSSGELSDLDVYNMFAFPERRQALKREAGSSPDRVRKQARQSIRARQNDFSKNMRLTDMLRPGKARQGPSSSALDKITALEDAIKTEGIDWDELDELEDSIAQARESHKTHATSVANAVKEAKKAVYARFDNDGWVDADLAWQYAEARTGPAAAHRLSKEFHTLDFGSVSRENPHREAVLQAASDSWPPGFYEMVRDDGALYTVHTLKRFLVRKDYSDYLRQLPDVWTQWALHQMLVTDDPALQDLYFDLVVRMREIDDSPTDLYFWALEGMNEAGYCGRPESAQVLDFIPTAQPPACILRGLRLILEHAVEIYNFDAFGESYNMHQTGDRKNDHGSIRQFAKHIATLACDAQIESSGAIVCESALAKLMSRARNRRDVVTGLVEGIPRDTADPDYVNEKARFRLLGLARRAVAFAKNDRARFDLGYVELQMAYTFLEEYAGEEYNPETHEAYTPNELISNALRAISFLVAHNDAVFTIYPLADDDRKPPPLSSTTDLEARQHLLLYAVHSALLLMPHVIERVDIHGAINGVPAPLDPFESVLWGEPRRKIYDTLEHFRGTVNPTLDTLPFYHALTFACKILRASTTQHRALV